MPHVQLDDLRLFFTDDGEGEGAGDPPLLFVHGFSALVAAWLGTLD